MGGGVEKVLRNDSVTASDAKNKNETRNRNMDLRH